MRFARITLFYTGKIIGLLLLLGLLFWGLQYSTTAIYDFRPAKPFSGKNWYNPYQHPGALKVKGNFHAHSQAWGGISNGKGSPQQIRQAYADSGYRVKVISNYFSIDTTGKATDPLYIPTYEHGMNFQKSHCLVINSGGVSYTDYMLYQTISQQQTVIEAIKRKGGIIALAHPDFAFARSMEGMQQLEHYDLVEVLNHFGFSDKHWDTSLSAGKLAFLVADDDSHGIVKGEIFHSWTEIFVDKPVKSEVLKSLTSGHAVGVAVMYPNSPLQNEFVSCKLNNDTLSVKFKNRADSILFIGQNGRTKKVLSGSDSGFYVLKPNDTYIRIKSINAETQIYLNPVVRYESKLQYAAQMLPKQRTLLTWLVRAFVVLIDLLIVRTMVKLWRKKLKRSKA